MKFISATTRVTFGLICLAISVWMAAFTLGMFPDPAVAIVRGRAALCENVALHCSLLASRNDHRTIQTALHGLVQRNKDLQSAAVRRPDGTLLLSVGPHEAQWDLPPGNQSTRTQMRVPILAGESLWGMVELRFREPAANAGWLDAHPMIALTVFTGAGTYLLFFVYLRKMFQHLDPSRVIPRRVRQTLDTMAEGLLVLDTRERILLANRAFAESLGVAAEELTGRKASDLPFEIDSAQLTIEGFPWDRAMRAGEPQIGDLLTLRGERNQSRVMKVSATPIYSDDGQQRGALASFDDVTAFEQSRVELRKMLDALSQSRDEIQRQNLELERLATRDPLTGCMNRRAFFADMERYWSTAARHNTPISCIMLDLDRFKLINDNHGHKTGDIVLQKTAELLRRDRRPTDLVGRFGGEEFCLLLPHTDLDGAWVVAEQIRQAIETTDFEGLTVTTSLGVSARSMQARDPQEMIEQADQSLYVAKRDGRNRVVRFDEARDKISVFEKQSDVPRVAASDTSRSGDEAARDPAIPFHAVTALLSALAYRDQVTADHSRRVADLCVATARRLLPVAECYILEIAALLHDIGKIGVPDAILLKKGKLAADEWRVMNTHERIGVEIVRSTFSSPELAEIIHTFRAWFGGHPAQNESPRGDKIPLAARILAIADAFDSMTNGLSYRQPISPEQAIAELRRWAGRQFDPELVERFVTAIHSHDPTETAADGRSPAPAALSLGTQIERIVEALDNHDLASIPALASRLQQTAQKYGSPAIAKAAAALQEVSPGDSDVKQVVQLTAELLELCRSAQRVYLNDGVGPAGAGQRDEGRHAAEHNQTAAAQATRACRGSTT